MATRSVGSLYHGGTIPGFIQKPLHFGIGYGSEYLLGGDPLAGGVGRLTGEIVAEWQTPWVLKSSSKSNLDRRRQQALMNTQFMGGLVNFCLGLDVNTGARSAYRVAEYNGLLDAWLLKKYQNSNFNLKKWAEFLQSLRNQRGKSAFIQPTLEGLNNFSQYYLDEGEPTARFYDLQNTWDPMGDQIGIGLPMAIQYGGKALVKIGEFLHKSRNYYDNPVNHQYQTLGSIVVPLLFDGADAFTSFVGLGIEKVATGIGFSQPVAQDLGDLAPLVAGAFGASSIFKIGSFRTFTSNVVKNFSIQSMNVLKKPFSIMRREEGTLSRFLGLNPNNHLHPCNLQGSLKIKPGSIGTLNPKNVALYERYLVDLRRNMGRPHAENPRLAELFEEYHRTEVNCVGSGSTAASIRHELRTGELVGGKSHIQKGKEAINGLERWLRGNRRTASPNDVRAAENMLQDLRDAFSNN